MSSARLDPPEAGRPVRLADQQPLDLTRNQVLACLGAHFLSSLSVGVAIGGMVPLIAVTLEARGVDGTLIGVNSAMTSLGVIAAAPLVPSLVKKLGASWAIVAGLVLTTVSAALLGYTESLVLWLILRALIGVGIVTQWVVSETWMQAIVTERRRGLVMSICVTAIAAGFAAGPMILSAVGTDGVVPFLIFATMIGLTALPVIPIRHLAPKLALNERGSPIRLLRQAPTIALAAIAVGMVDSSFFTFLPLYGLRLDLSDTVALALLTAALAGNVFLQIPLGWLADQVSRRALLVALAAVCVVAPIVMRFAIVDHMTVVFPLLLVWGGAAFGLYTVALTMLGERYKAGELASANAAFVVCFELANLVGPPMAGTAMELWEPHGLLVFMGSVALIFITVALVRGQTRRQPPNR